MVSRKKVLGLVRSRDFRQMTAEEMARRLKLGRGESDDLLSLLEALEREGHVVRVKKSHWVNARRAGLVVGRLHCNRRGFGFLTPVGDGAEDIYVAADDMRDAMHGDLAVVELRAGRRGGRGGRKLGPAGRVIRVIEHVNTHVVGRFVPGRKLCRVVPDNPHLVRDIYVAPEDTMGAAADEQVLVELVSWPSLHGNPEGEVREVLGAADAPGVDVRSVVLEFGLPAEFPEEVVAAARALPKAPPAEEVSQRRDLRDMTTVTVDPEDAKDFDDALSLHRDPESGRRIVGVHIADLSFYVRPDSVLDREARQRGCSVYLANQVVPMLPHEQSRDLLSLNEGKDRLAKTVFLTFDEGGKVVDHSLCYSVIRVDRRMSYREVQQVLDARDSDDPAAAAALEKLPDDLFTLIMELDALAAQVRALRREVGSIDLDVPEYHVDIDADGRVFGVAQIVRDRSHGLVEEFMLAANRAVASFMTEKKLPALYRVHEAPPEEDLVEFAEFVRTVTGRKVDAADRKQLQALLAQVARSNFAEAVNMQLLRAMQRALYSPRLSPHYALHFPRYCHFTSPVRRYPDLVVHQILDAFLTRRQGLTKLRARWGAVVPAVADHCNAMQDRADRAEREIVKIKLLRYLEQHKDEVFDAVITGVQEYGFFVRLNDYMVEGLVKVQSLRDDFYRYDDKRKALVGTRHGRRFGLGQPVRVVLASIDMAQRQADFIPYRDAGGNNGKREPRMNADRHR